MKNENAIAEKIRGQYTVRNKTKLDALVELDRKVKMPAEVFTYAFGTVGALTMGTGMSLAMGVIGAGLTYAMTLGVAVGLVGLVMVGVNYFIYKQILKSRKAKYSREILALSNQILNV